MTSTNPIAELPLNPLGVQKIRTMIEGFDDISHGGLPVGRTTILSGTSGTGKTMLAVQFIYNGIDYFDEPGILSPLKNHLRILLKTPTVLVGISKN
jgi:circadian clock protein KaiC